eukprot:1847525-Pyramimonas_sp.AAC.1
MGTERTAGSQRLGDPRGNDIRLSSPIDGAMEPGEAWLGPGSSRTKQDQKPDDTGRARSWPVFDH